MSWISPSQQPAAPEPYIEGKELTGYRAAILRNALRLAASRHSEEKVAFIEQQLPYISFYRQNGQDIAVLDRGYGLIETVATIHSLTGEANNLSGADVSWHMEA